MGLFVPRTECIKSNGQPTTFSPLDAITRTRQQTLNIIIMMKLHLLLSIVVVWAFSSPEDVHGFLPGDNGGVHRLLSSPLVRRSMMYDEPHRTIRMVRVVDGRRLWGTTVALQSSRRPNVEDHSYHRQQQHDRQDDDEQADEQEAFFRRELDSMQQMLDDELRTSSSSPLMMYGGDDDAVSSFTPYLTNTAIRRRQVEIQLLASLAHSDAAVDELVNVWIHECPSAKREINAILALEQHCESLASTTQMLQQMCASPSNDSWPELHNRLALVLAMNGRTQEANRCVQKVLRLKPWHFEAQHLRVLLALQQQSSSPGGSGGTSSSSVTSPRALRAARLSLPPLSQPRRRRQWVELAVRQAKERLAQDQARSASMMSTMSLSAQDDGSSFSSSWQ
jgi:hypothetical protein